VKNTTHSGIVTGERHFEITGVNPKKYLTPRNAQNVANRQFLV